MLVELDTKDLIRLIKSIEPSFEHTDNDILKRYGEWKGTGPDWKWNNNLDKLSEGSLWLIYKFLVDPLQKPKTKEELRIENIDKQISEIKEILEDGIGRNNKSQVEACVLEIERLELSK